MSDAVLPTNALPVRKGRRWAFLGLAALLFVGLLGGLYVYLSLEADWELQQAIAEADRLEPDGWRLPQIEEQRRVVPDEENSAPQVLAAGALVPNAWGMEPAFYEQFEDLPPEAQLNGPQLAALRAELQKAAAARGPARGLARLPRGRHAISYSPDFLSLRVPHLGHARALANLLKYDALLRAQDGDADGALESCRAILNAGRSIGDEPLAISQVARIAVRAAAVSALERTLAQGEPSPEALADLQRAFEEEEPENLLLYLVRGERAGNDALLQALANGAMDRVAIARGALDDNAEPLADTLSLYVPGGMKRHRAAVLRHFTRVVEAARLPVEQRQAVLARLDEEAKGGPMFVRMLAPAGSKLGASCQRSHAQLRCAIVALAAERYRRQHGRWPESPAALVETGLLKETPLDPYDGAPLRYRRTADGVVVYALGPDGTDDGGTLNRKKPLAEGSDFGFQLWDAAKRRQPPQPPQPADDALPEGAPP